MKHKAYKLLALAAAVLVLVSTVGVFAGTTRRLGTAGAMELLIPVGARGTALSGNFTAGITGIDAMFWNPAGLAGSSKIAEVMASQMNYIADIGLGYAAVQANAGKIGHFGASIKTVNFGDIPETREDAPDGTGATFSPSFTVIGASYARAMTDRILFGVTTKIVSERIMNVSASGVGFDFGVQYITQMGLRLGVAIKNLGSQMRFNGTNLERRVILNPIGQSEDLRVVSQVFDMPTTMDIGMAYTVNATEGHAVTLMGNFRNNQFGYDAYGAGMEYSLETEKFGLALRGGATINQDVEAGKWVFMNDQWVYGPSFGVGLHYQLAQNLGLGIEYAYRLTQRFADNQVFCLTVAF
jgi:opacity protein-like surface antigen